MADNNTNNLASGSAKLGAAATGLGNITNVQVAVRCRPVNGEERKTGQPVAITCQPESKSIQVSYGPAGKKTTKAYTFDKVFGMYSTQEEVFSTVVRPIVDEALAGFNCTIFAYGQTGTGKTHTMEGDIHSEENAGIVPRTVKSIFETLETSGAEYTIRVSFLELYNEELQDLLSSTRDKKLKLCEDVAKGVVCHNLEEITVLNVADIFEILQRGIQNRQTAATLCNKNSSRSHSIFTMKIMIKECNVDGEEVVRHGQLNLVDLAGSECVGRSGAKNDRAREAGNINQSLLTLGRVITALVDHHGHIPYRDSKLTRLLQESLGGRAKTCIIATLSPSQLAVDESMSTLDYAHRAKSIKNQPTANQRMTKKVVLKEYCAEIEQLRAQLMLTREKNGVFVDPQEFYAMEARIAAQEAQLTECESALRTRTEECKGYKAERDGLEARAEESRAEAALLRVELGRMQSELRETCESLRVTEAERWAAEAVVAAQTSTEASLLQHGAQLQQEVAARRLDVQSLLSKVDWLQEEQRQRLRTAEEFAQEQEQRRLKLVGQVQEMLGQSGAVSGDLCEGVAEMLRQGRATCGALQAGIDLALGSLARDAQTAEAVMVDSCGQLTSHLSRTNRHVAETLGELQTNLSDWLITVESSLKQTTDELHQQHGHLEELSEEFTRQSEAQAGLQAAYFCGQKSRGQKAVQLTAALRENVAELSARHQKELNLALDGAAQQLAEKSRELQSTVSVLLQGMLSTATASFAATRQSADRLAEDLQTEVRSGVAEIEVTIESDAQAAAVFQTSLTDLQGEALAVNSQQVVRGAEMNRLVSDKLLAVYGKVEDQRTDLTRTVTVLLEDVQSALEVSAAAQVQRTADSAAQLRTDVTQAAEGMDRTAQQAMQNFIGFMDDRGADLCGGLTAHFGSLSEHLDGQDQGLQEMGSRAADFDEALQASETLSRSQKNGTPTKQSVLDSYCVPEVLEPLPVTRDHKQIRNEAKRSAGEISRADQDEGMVNTTEYEPELSMVNAGDEEILRLSNASDKSDGSVRFIGQRGSTSSRDSHASIAGAGVSKRRKTSGNKKETSLPGEGAADHDEENTNPNNYGQTIAAVPSSSMKLGRLNRTNSRPNNQAM